MPIQKQLEIPLEITTSSQPEVLDLRNIRLLVTRLHDLLRDNDSQSNIINRLDEIIKLIFSKVIFDKAQNHKLSKLFSSAEVPVNSNAIRSYYKELAHQYSSLIPKRFRELSCSDDAIIKCIATLQSLNFASTRFDVTGLAYEEVIRNTFNKGDHQQFFTPPHIVDFIISACKPYIKGDICDPASGTGGFLASIVKHKINYSSLTSIEIDERLSWISGINMLLHEADNFHTFFIPNGGTLSNEANQLFSSFDTIITNPPFGSDFADSETLDTFKLGSGRTARRRGILFIERCHALLRERGVLAIILDEGVLNLSHATDVRKFISRNFNLEAVINLPETTFMPYATVNSSILIMSKKADNISNPNIFFAKADKVGRKTNGDEDINYDERGKSHLNSDLPLILKAWQRYCKYGKVETSENIYITDIYSNLSYQDNDYRIDFQFHHPSRIDSQKLISNCIYPLKRLDEICIERNISVTPHKELAGEVICYTSLTNIEANTGRYEQVSTLADSLKSAVKMYYPGDIIFAKMRPNLRKVVLASFPEPGFVSSECSVFTIKKELDGSPVVDPLILSVLLRSDFVYGQIRHLVAGIGRPRVKSKDLRQVMIPLPSKDIQEQIHYQYLSQRQKVDDINSEIKSLLTHSQLMLTSSVQEVVSSFSGHQRLQITNKRRKEMMFDPTILKAFLKGEFNPIDTLSWLAESFLPEIVKTLNKTDVRRKLGIYSGEKIPENERNLTDTRNRVSLIIEYELARIANSILENLEIKDIFWTYVVANRFPDLEVRTTSGHKGLRVEVKCLQSISEEKSANFDTLRKDIHPKTDFVVIFAWDWKNDPENINWDRASFVYQVYVFHASSLALLRDWYWLNCPPKDLGNGLQGFDLRYAVNCKEGKYNEEEGNYGKLLRIWQQDFEYEPLMTDLLRRTVSDYLTFKNEVVRLGFDRLAYSFLPKLSGYPEITPVLFKDKQIGWQSGDTLFLLNSIAPKPSKQKVLLRELGINKVFRFSDKYHWSELRYEQGTLKKKRSGKKPKHLIPINLDQAEN
ncbi:type I restriction modification DNA specificity domain protein [Lyngbya aestuarii BL J]|uniref:Type I restriction modification DNA specificity domain protein n=1 Tax=Lyngbya aestuarii BL J TaxID=1348334 RepID=U7QP03_9CYAN|nr:N-6 DNA methylase [Lyngbya aestuarii]ERT08131.1 type I restriction modification DNA specificity domain protein [Lyngbya aestuarii BL J]